MYYPAPMIENRKSAVSLALLFDDIHFVTISDFSTNPTNYLKSLPNEVRIGVIGEKNPIQTRRVGEFFAFALDYRELMGSVFHYHPHTFDQLVTQISAKLVRGEAIPVDELLGVIQGTSSELDAYNEFRKNFPEIDDDLVLRVAPTAMKLAKENDWVLVSDVAEMPVPFVTGKDLNIKALTSILAEECIKVAIPKCDIVCADELLEVRSKLNDFLVPFRFGMQKMTTGLRAAIKDAKSIDEVKNECAFIARSQVEPAMFELQQKIKNENDKLFLKVFGKIVSWVPFIAKSFLAPTPDQIYKTLVKAYGDFGSITESIHENSVIKEPGISYLLGINSSFRKN